MSERNKLSPPPTAEMDDAGHAVAKGLIGVVPVAGSALAEIFSLIVAPPLEKRRDAWLRALASAVNELRATKGVSIAKLQQDERFVSLVLNATQVALRNHHKLKLDYIRQAVISGFHLIGDFADDETHTFVRLIDDLSPNQLRFAANIKGYGALDGHIASVFFAGDPHVHVKDADVDWIAAHLERELLSRGLYEKFGKEWNAPYQVTEFGYRFMIFLRGEETTQDREWMDEQRRVRAQNHAS